MKPRIFRPDTPDAPISPSWRQWRGLVYTETARSLAWAGRFLSSRTLKCLLWWVGFVVQVVLLVLTWACVEVVADVAELWLALARKHVAITS